MKITKYICQNEWAVGIVTASIDQVLKGSNLDVMWLRHNYKDRWFADPFVLDVDDRYIYILVEEFYKPIDRGRISKLTIDRNTLDIVYLKPVLELETHLSFPFIRRENNQIYVIPENQESGHSIEYIYDPKSEKLVYNRIICEQSLMDAVMTNLFGNELVFSTVYPDHQNLYIWEQSKDGDLFVQNGVIRFDNKTARNGGDWFEHKGIVYRIAQDCNRTYGGAFIIQKVTKEGNIFKFEDIRRVEPADRKFNLGIHTFNQFGGIIVVDSKRKKHPYCFKAFQYMRKMFSK